MKRTYRSLSLILTLLLFAACGTGQDGGQSSETAVIESQTTPQTVEDDPLAQYDPNIPAGDYGGRTFMFIYGESAVEPNYDLCADSINGDPLNDAVYERNQYINEKYNIEIQYESMGYGDTRTQVAKTVQAGDSTYDVMINNCVYSTELASEGHLYQLNDFPYLDFSKPYWDAGSLTGSSFGGKNFFAHSDMNFHAMSATPCVLFNKKLAKTYQIPDLYATVEAGDWTFDLMSSYISQVTADTDGDGTITQYDTLGFISNTFCVDCLLSATGYQTIRKDEDDIPVLNMQTEQYYNIIGKILDLLSEENGAFLCDRYQDVDREEVPKAVMEADRALFWICNFKDVALMRNMDSDFGILPLPKLDENQAEYRTHYQRNIGGANSIPVTVSDPELCGMVLEDMAYQSMRTVKPTYFDVLLQGKVLRDDESLVSLNIIYNSYYSDFGFFTTSVNIDPLGDLRTYAEENRRDYVSRIERKQKAYTKYLEKFIDAYRENT